MSFYASSTKYPVTFRPADRESSKFGPSVTHDGFYYYEPDIMFEPRLFDEQDGASLGLDPNESAQLHLYWNSTAEGLYYLDSGKLYPICSWYKFDKQLDTPLKQSESGSMTQNIHLKLKKKQRASSWFFLKVFSDFFYYILDFQWCLQFAMKIAFLQFSMRIAECP